MNYIDELQEVEVEQQTRPLDISAMDLALNCKDTLDPEKQVSPFQHQILTCADSALENHELVDVPDAWETYLTQVLGQEKDLFDIYYLASINQSLRNMDPTGNRWRQICPKLFVDSVTSDIVSRVLDLSNNYKETLNLDSFHYVDSPYIDDLGDRGSFKTTSFLRAKLPLTEDASNYLDYVMAVETIKKACGIGKYIDVEWEIGDDWKDAVMWNGYEHPYSNGFAENLGGSLRIIQSYIGEEGKRWAISALRSKFISNRSSFRIAYAVGNSRNRNSRGEMRKPRQFKQEVYTSNVLELIRLIGLSPEDFL